MANGTSSAHSKGVRLFDALSRAGTITVFSLLLLGTTCFVIFRLLFLRMNDWVGLPEAASGFLLSAAILLFALQVLRLNMSFFGWFSVHNSDQPIVLRRAKLVLVSALCILLWTGWNAYESYRTVGWSPPTYLWLGGVALFVLAVAGFIKRARRKLIIDEAGIEDGTSLPRKLLFSEIDHAYVARNGIVRLVLRDKAGIRDPRTGAEPRTWKLARALSGGTMPLSAMDLTVSLQSLADAINARIDKSAF